MTEMITIPKHHYEHLLETLADLRDLKAVDDVIAKLEAGETEMLPAAFVDRMLEGESLLKLWRQHRGLTQAELAERSGVARVMISEIEAKKKIGSVATVKALATALGIDMDDLV